jgi:translation initiation factor IF-3
MRELLITINGLALRHVGVVGTGEQSVAIAADNALDVTTERGKRLVYVSDDAHNPQYTIPIVDVE